MKPLRSPDQTKPGFQTLSQFELVSWHRKFRLKLCRLSLMLSLIVEIQVMKIFNIKEVFFLNKKKKILCKKTINCFKILIIYD